MNAILILLLSVILSCGQEVWAKKNIHDGRGRKKSAMRTWRGNHISIDEVPFVVSIEVSQNGSTSYCTGSIVHTNWILSSATCFERAPSQLKITYGVDDRSAPNAPSIVVDLPQNTTEMAQIIHMHPFFMDYLDFHRYDVALIKLDQSIPLSGNVPKVAVLEQEAWPMHEGKQEPEERDCLVVGFGQNIHNDTKLHSGVFDFQFGRTCECFFSNPYGLCTRRTQGSNFDTACFDDWGGPMLCDGNLVGIFSNLGRCSNDTNPIRCDDEKLVGGYTYLQPYLPWMEQIVKLTLAPIRDTSEEQQKKIIHEQKKLEKLKKLLESEFDSREQALKKQWLKKYRKEHPNQTIDHSKLDEQWKEQWVLEKQKMFEEQLQQVKQDEWQKAEQKKMQDIESMKKTWENQYYDKGLHAGMDARKQQQQHFRAARSTKCVPSLALVLIITVMTYHL